MEQRHNSAALVWTAALFVVVVTLILVPAFALHGFLPKPPPGSDVILMQVAGVVSVLGLIQSWRIGGGLDDFVLGSGFSFSAEKLKEHGFVVPFFIVFASNSFLILIAVDLLMLATGTQ